MGLTKNSRLLAAVPLPHSAICLVNIFDFGSCVNIVNNILCPKASNYIEYYISHGVTPQNKISAVGGNTADNNRNSFHVVMRMCRANNMAPIIVFLITSTRKCERSGAPLKAKRLCCCFGAISN